MSQVLELRTFERQPATTEPCLAFTNPGTLEIELVKLLGVSVKESNDPIGFFGTGLKYALAAAMRLGGSMTIITGGKRYEVGGRKIMLRDKEFTQVTLDGEPLGFTTELGKQWEAWMVVRELYSNALDEGGETRATERHVACPDGHTVIALHGQCFLDVWNERASYFLNFDQERAVHRSEYVDAYPVHGGSKAVFYRGIRIHETVIPPIYRYNLLDRVTLTEDRTLKYQFQLNEAIEKAIITSTDREFIMRMLTTGDSTYEGKLDFGDGHVFIELTDEFKSVCADLLDLMPEKANKAALRFYQSRTQSKQAMIPAQLTRIQQMQLDKAASFVRKLVGADLDRFPIEVVRWLGQNTFGLAKDGCIYLGLDCFDKGTKFLASTLYEEFVHCQYGFADESRGLQTWCFDRIISLGEQLLSEPL